MRNKQIEDRVNRIKERLATRIHGGNVLIYLEEDAEELWERYVSARDHAAETHHFYRILGDMLAADHVVEKETGEDSYIISKANMIEIKNRLADVGILI